MQQQSYNGDTMNHAQSHGRITRVCDECGKIMEFYGSHMLVTRINLKGLLLMEIKLQFVSKFLINQFDFGHWPKWPCYMYV